MSVIADDYAALNSLRKCIGWSLWALFAVYAFLSLFYVAWQAHSDYSVIAAWSVIFLMASIAALRWLPRLQSGDELSREYSFRLLLSVVILGIALRIAFIAVVPPVQKSDMVHYWILASHIVDEGRYYFTIPGGELRAWRPPGYPILLAAFMLVFGKALWIPLLINLICFSLTCVAIRSLAELCSDSRRLALFAVLLFSVWPGAVAGAGLAMTEPVSLALLTISVWAIIRAQAGNTWWAVLAGLCTGYGCLVRPSFLFIPLLWILFAAIRRGQVKRGMRAAAVAIVVTLAVIMPWTVRNYHVLGDFVVVSTNGGSVFYRGNNPLSAGETMPVTERPLDSLQTDEVRWHRTGFAWGLEWIRSNPLEFLILIFKKQAIYSGTDDFWLYWAVEQGHGNVGRGYRMATTLTNGWWVLILLLLTVAAFRARRFLAGDARGSLLVATFLYPLLVHSVFGSQARFHTPAIGLMAIFAAMALWPANGRTHSERPQKAARTPARDVMPLSEGSRR